MKDSKEDGPDDPNSLHDSSSPLPRSPSPYSFPPDPFSDTEAESSSAPPSTGAPRHRRVEEFRTQLFGSLDRLPFHQINTHSNSDEEDSQPTPTVTSAFNKRVDWYKGDVTYEECEVYSTYLAWMSDIHRTFAEDEEEILRQERAFLEWVCVKDGVSKAKRSLISRRMWVAYYIHHHSCAAQILADCNLTVKQMGNLPVKVIGSTYLMGRLFFQLDSHYGLRDVRPEQSRTTAVTDSVKLIALGKWVAAQHVIHEWDWVDRRHRWRVRVPNYPDERILDRSFASKTISQELLEEMTLEIKPIWWLVGFLMKHAHWAPLIKAAEEEMVDLVLTESEEKGIWVLPLSDGTLCTIKEALIEGSGVEKWISVLRAKQAQQAGEGEEVAAAEGEAVEDGTDGGATDVKEEKAAESNAPVTVRRSERNRNRSADTTHLPTVTTTRSRSQRRKRRRTDGLKENEEEDAEEEGEEAQELRDQLEQLRDRCNVERDSFEALVSKRRALQHRMEEERAAWKKERRTWMQEKKALMEEVDALRGQLEALGARREPSEERQ